MKNINLFNSPIKILGGSIIIIEGILGGIMTTNLTEYQKDWIIIGMIGALVLTILVALLMHYIDNKKILSNATPETLDKKFDYDIFIAFPIAAVKNITERKALNDFAKRLETELKRIGYKKIFNASLHFSNNHEHQPPPIAAKIDIKAIDSSKNFILLYPEKIATSALIELGYAMSGNKNIVMCSNNIYTLPFLARGFSEAFRNVNYLEYKDNDHLINILIENHQEYFKY